MKSLIFSGFFICQKSSYIRASRLSSRMSLIRRIDIELMLKTKPYEVLRPKDEFDVTEYYTAEQIVEKYKVNAVWIYTRQNNVPKVRIRQSSFYKSLFIFRNSVGLTSLYFLNNLFRWLSSVKPSSSTISFILMSLCRSRLSTIFIL